MPFPPPGDLPDPGIEPESPVSPHWQVDSLPLSPWKAFSGCSSAHHMHPWGPFPLPLVMQGPQSLPAQRSAALPQDSAGIEPESPVSPHWQVDSLPLSPWKAFSGYSSAHHMHPWGPFPLPLVMQGPQSLPAQRSAALLSRRLEAAPPHLPTVDSGTFLLLRSPGGSPGYGQSSGLLGG